MKKRLTLCLLGILYTLVIMSVIHCAPPTGTSDEPDNDPPGVPYNLYPADGTSGHSLSPMFSWECEDPEGDEMHFTVRLLSEDRAIWVEEGILEFSVQCPETLDPNMEYYWNVIPYDIYDQYPWVETYCHFFTGTDYNNPPQRPFNPRPGVGAVGVYPADTLFWDCFDPDGDDLTYNVYFGPGFDEMLVGEDQTAEYYLMPEDLLADTFYHWTVVAHDPYGGSASTYGWYFFTAENLNRPPEQPYAPYPEDGAVNVPADVQLQWSCSDPEDDPLTYSVYLSLAGGTLMQIASGITIGHYDLTGLESGTAYDWMIKADDGNGNEVLGPIWTFTTEDSPGYPGVYAELTIWRSQTYADGTITRNDFISARFDSAYAPDGPIEPLQPASVSCDQYDLVWEPYRSEYFYSDYLIGHYLLLGDPYTFTIGGGGVVPSLVADPIVFPMCAPYITSPEPFAFVSFDTGFELQWADYSGQDCAGMIAITIMDLNADSTGVYIITPNDGSYTFTPDDLSVIDPMAYQFQVILIWEIEMNIAAQGYDTRSRIRARNLAVQMIMKEF